MHIRCGNCDHKWEKKWLEEDLALEAIAWFLPSEKDEMEKLARKTAGPGPMPTPLRNNLEAEGWVVGASRLIIRRCPNCHHSHPPCGWLANEDFSIDIEVLEEKILAGDKAAVGRLAERFSGVE